jgi:putative ATP-dependent endonuclease of OLD family
MIDPFAFGRHSPAPPVRSARLLVVVEGVSDIRFLKCFNALLLAQDPQLPDLSRLEEAGQVVFVPTGGGGLEDWAFRLAPLGLPEFHLYDREVPPLTDQRRAVAAAINSRPGCRAVLTQRRALENYLPPEAIAAARGLAVEVDDHHDIATLVAQQRLARHGGAAWETLPYRSRQRRRYRAKLWLSAALEHLTLPHMLHRDPQGEVRGWFQTLAQLLTAAD